MAETFTVSDQRAHTALVMAKVEASAFEHFLQQRACALRKEADCIDAFLAGQIDAHLNPKSRVQSPSHEITSWYEAINKDRDDAEQALRKQKQPAR